MKLSRDLTASLRSSLEIFYNFPQKLSGFSLAALRNFPSKQLFKCSLVALGIFPLNKHSRIFKAIQKFSLTATPKTSLEFKSHSYPANSSPNLSLVAAQQNPLQRSLTEVRPDPLRRSLTASPRSSPKIYYNFP
ncbi:hypothetical protein Nepgr_005103 [Nepenthes gracilis]|uniref:Uncharacterized protein n=1 Tax=Nepenthes gracilis TaxID=150966 RepID=A0AAD3S310_NEPGR|nr:hypothetical protein Nepgr_005103 [Nepenthes gracilis]